MEETNDFIATLPKLDWYDAKTSDDGIKQGIYGHEAVHFLKRSEEAIGPEGCEDMLLQWQELETLSAVRIGGDNAINEEAVKSLTQLLVANDSILYFSMYGNALTTPALKLFAENLAYNRTLVALQLLDAKITDEGVALIAKQLENNNRSLLQIDLSHNLIKDAGAKSMAKAIRVNDVLTTIALSANEIGDAGCEALAKAMEVNYTLCFCDLSRNIQKRESTSRLAALVKRNTDALYDAVKFCSENVKQGPLRKAKICFVGKNLSGKSKLIAALKGKPYYEEYVPTPGAKVTQVLTRLRGQVWNGIARLPSSEFGFQFLARFVNIKLDEKVEKIEAEAGKEKIGFRALGKKRRPRRGSVKERRGSVTGGKKLPANSPLHIQGDDNRNSSNNRNSRRSSVAMSVLNAVLGEAGAQRRRNSIKGVLNKVAHPFNRKKNDLLEDEEYEFFDPTERKPGEATNAFNSEKLSELFDVHVLAKARRERDFLGFNLLELSGNRAFYTVHHAFLTKQALYVLVFNMEHLSNRGKSDERLDEIKYINYWLKVIRYHSPDARLLVVGTHCDKVAKELYGSVESDISKLVFPELHRAHARKKEQLKINKAVEAANEFARELEENSEDKKFVSKKTRLIVNAADRRLFFPVELSTGKGISNVRIALDEAAQKQKYYGQKIPVRWLKFLDALRKDSPNYFCTPDRVEAIAFQNLENHKEEMRDALELFHELGYILHITEIEQIANTVITDTLSFYRIIFRLIFTEDMTLFDQQEAKQQGLGEFITQTIETGLIDQKLIDYLWKDELNLVSKEEDDVANKGKVFFLEYAQLTLVLAQYKFGAKKNLYVIPSMLPFNHELVTKTKEEYGEGVNLKCKFRFSGYLTLGVFERLLCLCLQYAGNQANSLEPVLAMGWAQVSFGTKYTFRLERLPDDIVLQVIESKAKKAYKLIVNFEKMLNRLRNILGQGFMWKTTLEDKEGNFIDYDKGKEQKLPGWF